MKPQRTILVTFAGRRDRMRLLTRYAAAAMDAGLIDDWHVWDFTRNAEDAIWLRETFPLVQTTPSHTLEYFRFPKTFSYDAPALNLSLEVRAVSDVHIGLQRQSGAGCSYEIVLGGWGNAGSAIRTFESAEQLEYVAARPADNAAATQIFKTPALLPEFEFLAVALELGSDGLKVFVNGALLMSDPTPVEPGAFDLLYRTGYGANGEWRFPETEEMRQRLFVWGPEPHHPANAVFYTRAYQYYTAQADAYRDDVLLKCDDDIVYFDLQRLADFIAFRRANPDFFLISANVVNNGVCAYFQQQSGAIPAEMMECELPPGGMCGTLWADGEKAEALHGIFLVDPSAFEQCNAPPVIWNQRVSINFIALLGRDLPHIPDLTADDEHDLCYGVRKRARKSNCIFPGFVAAHLSFWKQDASMDVDALLEAYETLADQTLGAFNARPANGERESDAHATVNLAVAG